MGRQGLDAEALRGMVAAGQIGDPRFPGQVHRLFRNLPGQIGIRAPQNGPLEKPLGAAGTPAQAPHRTLPVTEELYRASEAGGNPLRQRGGGNGNGQTSQPAQVLIAEAGLRLPAAGLGPLGVVAQFRMGVQGQVIGEEVDIPAQQGRQALFAKAGDPAILAPPEPAVVHQHPVRLLGHRRIQQGLAGGHPADQTAYGFPAFHLQAVWAIILETAGFQKLIQIGRQCVSLHFVLDKVPNPLNSGSATQMRKLWLIFAQSVTVSLALLFVITTLKPEWLSQGSGGTISLREAVIPGGSRNAPDSYREAVRHSLPSVVHIYTSKAVKTPRHPLFDDPMFRHFFGDRFDGEAQRAAGLGSGVIVSPEGYILTNYHVVEAADDIEVALNDGRTFKAEVIGTDPDTDLAVVRIRPGKMLAPKLPAITFGQMDNVSVGDVVLAIGNPFGVGQTVTMGIVSALGRSHLGINTFENFIQTDAAINPGNSGGALVDARGNLIGINTAIYSRSGGSLGIGFAIPVSTAKNVMEQIIRSGTVVRGWIGVEAQELTPDLADSFGLVDNQGAIIAGVLRGSPAAGAGIKPGDILTKVNGRPVKDPQAMLDLIASLRPESVIPFELRRGKQVLDLPVKVGKRPPMQRPKGQDDDDLDPDQ